MNVRKETMSEEELKQKARKELQSVTNPVERLRLQCFLRGNAGIKSLARYHISLISLNVLLEF